MWEMELLIAEDLEHGSTVQVMYGRVIGLVIPLQYCQHVSPSLERFILRTRATRSIMFGFSSNITNPVSYGCPED